MIINYGGGAASANKLPVLNDITLDGTQRTSYSIEFLTGTSYELSFSISIKTAGVPAIYTYKWILDDTILETTTSSGKYIFTEQGNHTLTCEVTNAAGTVSKSANIVVTTMEKSYSVNGGNWQTIPSGKIITLTSSGSIKFNYNPSATVTAIGAGMSGSTGYGTYGDTNWKYYSIGGNGGNGGQVITKVVNFTPNNSYTVQIGQASYSGGYSSLSGSGIDTITAYNGQGGSGGVGGDNGAMIEASSGGDGKYLFNGTSGIRYGAGGGGGCGSYYNNYVGTPYYGDPGAGGADSGGQGGSHGVDGERGTNYGGGGGGAGQTKGSGYTSSPTVAGNGEQGAIFIRIDN